MIALLSAVIPSPSQGVWYLGPIPIRAYSLCILIGMAIAVWLTTRRYSARGGDPEIVSDVALVGIPAGIIGARIYHVVTSWDPYFGPNGSVSEVFMIWHGGLGIWGGVLSAVCVAALYLRYRGLAVAPFADAAAPGIIIAQGVGRLGNWFNQEVFGSPTNLPWGLAIDSQQLAQFGLAPGTLVHPTFLYEMIWNFAVAALLIWIDRRYKTYGWQIFLIYAGMYCLGRCCLEGLRVDTTDYVFGVRINFWASVITVVFAVVMLIITGRKQLPTLVQPLAVTNNANNYDVSQSDAAVDSEIASSSGNTQIDGA